jgi:hypothetical protein
MNRATIYILLVPVYAVAIGIISYFSVQSAFAAVNVSKHPNAFQAQSSINNSWHDCTNCSEDALDMQDPNNDCWYYSPSGCNAVYFWYQGQNQYAADYTVTQYGGSCAGRTVTIRYYDGSIWKQLIRLNYVHLKAMTSLTSGSLSYAQQFSYEVGKTWDSETCSAWTGPNLHYSRNWNYGSSDHDSVSSPIAWNANIFNGYSYP